MAPQIDSLQNLSTDERECIKRATRTAARALVTKTPEDLQDYLKEELDKVIHGRGKEFSEALKGKGNAGVVMMTLFEGVSEVIDFFESNKDVLKAKRKNLRHQMRKGRFIFVLPEDDDTWSDEDRFIHDFMTLVKESRIPNLEALLGIRTMPPENAGEPTMYLALPFADINTGGVEEAPDNEELMATHAALEESVHVIFPGLRNNLSQAFRSGYQVVHLFRSIYEGRHYLKDYDLAFFMATCMSSLQWNLLHLMDHDTKTPVSLRDCIRLCKDLHLFFNEILAPNRRPYLRDKASTAWGDYILKASILTKKLERAYELARLKSFPIKPLARNAGEMAKMIASGLFELLYRSPSEQVDRPRDAPQVAIALAARLGDLSDFLSINPMSTFSVFEKYMGELPTDASLRSLLNPKPGTVIDVIIIFSHLPRYQRLALINHLKEQESAGQDSAGSVARCLIFLDEHYIRTLNAALKKHAKPGFFGGWRSQKSVEQQHRAQLIGQRFVPCVTLLMQAFGIENQVLGDDSGDIEDLVVIINDLNRAYAPGDMKPYFYPRVSDLLEINTNFADKIDQFPEKIDKMTRVACLLKEVADVVTRYEHVLQKKKFLEFLQDLTLDVRAVQREIETMCHTAESVASGNETVFTDERISNQLKNIVATITEELKASLKHFEHAAMSVYYMIKDPKFLERQRGEFIAKLEKIDKQYYALFQKEVKLKAIFFKRSSSSSEFLFSPSADNSPASISLASSSPGPRSSIEPLMGTFLMASTKRRLSSSPNLSVLTRTTSADDWARELQQFSLIALIESCHDAMSYWSQWGHKGTLLSNLKARVSLTERLTPEALKYYLLDLFRIVASYRQTWCGFFQAEYAHTKSCYCLARAIQSKQVHLVFPEIEDLLFEGQVVDLSEMPIDDIMDALLAKRNLASWEFAEDEIEETRLLSYVPA